MRDKTLLWILFCFLTLLNLAAAQAFGATTDNLLLSSVERSRDSHPIDEFPSIEKSKSQSSSKAEEKTAHEQITESIRTDSEQPLKPKTSGKVMVTTEEKTEAAKNSTEIVNDKTQTRELSAETKYERPTIALALGGGGVRGASHVGVLRVLKEANIPIDYIVGNSMGSIVGGLYAAGVPLEEIEKTMFDDSLRKAYLPNSIPARILGKPLEKAMHPFKKTYAGIWTGKKLSDFFEKHLPPGVVNVEDTPIPFSAVATNLIDGKAYRISDGKLSMAMRASSTIPPLLKPVAIGDKVFVDGGMRANLPASAARDTGADIVIAVLVDEPLKDVPAERFTKVGAIVQRVGDVMLAISDAHQLPFADIVINPDVSGLPILRGKVEDARRAIAAGEAAAKKALPDILREIREREDKSRLSAGQIPENLK